MLRGHCLARRRQFKQRLAQRHKARAFSLLPLRVEHHHQPVKERKKLAIDQITRAPNRHFQRLAVIGQRKQRLHEFRLGALAADHLRRHSFKFPQLLAEAVPVAILLGLEQIPLAVLLRQLAHQRLRHLANDLLLLHLVHARFSGDDHAQPLLLGHMHHQRRADCPARPARSAHGRVDLPAQQRLLQLGIRAQVNNGEDRHHVGRAAVGALHLRALRRKEQVFGGNTAACTRSGRCTCRTVRRPSHGRRGCCCRLQRLLASCARRQHKPRSALRLPARIIRRRRACAPATRKYQPAHNRLLPFCMVQRVIVLSLLIVQRHPGGNRQSAIIAHAPLQE